MKLILLTAYLLLQLNVMSQLIKDPAGANIGLSAYSKNFLDAFSFTGNTASLTKIIRVQAGIFSERRFLLNSTNFYSVAIVAPAHHGNFGFQASYFGFSKFNEAELGIAYAKTLGKIDIGIRFNYNNISIPVYGGSSNINFEIAGLVALTNKLIAGLQIYNPVGSSISKPMEKLPALYKFGIGYEASDKFYIALEIIKEENQPVNVVAGFQYYYEKRLFVRAGIATVTTSPYMAAGIRWKQVRLDITGSYHPYLGFTPGLVLFFDILKKGS